MGSISATLATSWRDGSLSYRFSVSPATAYLKNDRSRAYSAPIFTILLYDKSFFKVKSIVVPFPSMTQEVDDEGKATGYEVNEQDFCSEDDYRRITSWGIEWAGFSR
jgi:hypothetical protein